MVLSTYHTAIESCTEHEIAYETSFTDTHRNIIILKNGKEYFFQFNRETDSVQFVINFDDVHEFIDFDVSKFLFFGLTV